MSYYNDKFDANQQVDLEEAIAERLYYDIREAEEMNISQELAKALSQGILEMIIKELHPDLMTQKWVISDGNASEKYEDWVELCGVAEEWYLYLREESSIDDDGMDIAISDRDFNDIPEGDTEALNAAIRVWEEKIAEAAGYTTFSGHGSYSVSAASAMGLNLTVRIEEE